MSGDDDETVQKAHPWEYPFAPIADDEEPASDLKPPRNVAEVRFMVDVYQHRWFGRAWHVGNWIDGQWQWHAKFRQFETAVEWAQLLARYLAKELK